MCVRVCICVFVCLSLHGKHVSVIRKVLHWIWHHGPLGLVLGRRVVWFCVKEQSLEVTVKICFYLSCCKCLANTNTAHRCMSKQMYSLFVFVYGSWIKAHELGGIEWVMWFIKLCDYADNYDLVCLLNTRFSGIPVSDWSSVPFWYIHLRLWQHFLQTCFLLFHTLKKENNLMHSDF